MEDIRISDQTLRDGEQQVGIVFTTEQKLELAKEIALLGVDFIALMPVACCEERKITEELLLQNVPIVPDAPLKKQNIDQTKALGASRITLFTSVSDILLEAKDVGREENAIKSMEIARYAAQNGLIVDFAFEDASRAEIAYMTKLAQTLKPYIDHLVLCDTVGCLQPNLTDIWIKEFIKNTGLKIGIHCHNDLGLAVDNTVRAVLAGATLISGTFTGIGERAGNAALEQVLQELWLKHKIRLNHINYDKIDMLCKKVGVYAGGGPVAPFSEQAFYCETGIHVHAMMKNSRAYSVLPNTEPNIWFGKFSGISNYRWLFERLLNTRQSETTYSIMRDKIKTLAIQEKRSFSAWEIILMNEEGFFSENSTVSSTPELPSDVLSYPWRG